MWRERFRASFPRAVYRSQLPPFELEHEPHYRRVSDQEKELERQIERQMIESAATSAPGDGWRAEYLWRIDPRSYITFLHHEPIKVAVAISLAILLDHIFSRDFLSFDRGVIFSW